MSNIHDPFRYELEKYSRSYPSTSSTSNQWTHISRPNVFVYLENMFPAGIIVAGVGEPILKVIADQNTLLECLNVSYRHANILKAKALLRSPTIGIRYNYSIVDRNGVTTAQEVRKFQLRFKTIEDFEACAGIIGRYISCKPILGNGSNVSSSTSDLGLSNHAQVLNKIQPPLSVMQQQITKPQKEQSVALTTRQESCQKEYIVLDSPSRPSTSSSTSSFAATTDISSKPLQRSCTDISFQTPITQKSVTNILESTNQSLYNPQISPLPQRIDQRQTSPIQTTNNLEFHTLNQPSSSNESNDFNSSQKAVNSMDPVKEHMNLVK
ncbi:1858_t:CDS:2 [Scutellospora calospora]|uniref:1858_t:CDS:1 n=1 Tax=Scutellospora calospora TaxID=85575 RepID=A0ACA9KUD8_9GLOM|nr:1858_t:CDS:2 [Scutellospora calospora]